MISLNHAEDISNIKIATLNPGFQEKVQKWKNKLIECGVYPYIYEGYRSPQRQDELYARGRSLPGKIVTHAQGGQSFHNYGFAIDWVPLSPSEKAANMYEAGWGEQELYTIGNNLAEELGMRKLSWEMPHLEDNRFKDWRQLRETYGQVV